MAKPLLLMVGGNAGSGKTTFAEQFARLFSAPCVDFDALRFELKAKPNFSDEETAMINKIGLIIVRHLLDSRQPIVISGGLAKKANRQRFRTLASQAGYNARLVWLQVDAPVMRRRALEKIKAGETTKEIVAAAMANTELPVDSERPIMISGKHTFNTQVRGVLEKLSL
ncbi:ATP-binding protein [Candidatus Saccharibacteria bacterium]|nr:ATP-binding protein [Candidatus Saccharibacteria bacterium]